MLIGHTETTLFLFLGNFFLILYYHKEQRTHPLCPMDSGCYFSLWTQRSHWLPPPSSPTVVWSLRSELLIQSQAISATSSFWAGLCLLLGTEFPKKGNSFSFFYLFVAQIYLELVQLWLALGSCLYLPRAGVSGLDHHSQKTFLITKNADHWVHVRTGTSFFLGVAYTGPDPGHCLWQVTGRGVY